MTLNDENFFKEVLKNSDCVSLKQLKSELRLASLINTMINKYKKHDKINVRLLLNYFIIMYNQFGKFSSNILVFMVDTRNYDVLFTFLDYLFILPEKIEGIRVNSINKDIDLHNILKGL